MAFNANYKKNNYHFKTNAYIKMISDKFNDFFTQVDEYLNGHRYLSEEKTYYIDENGKKRYTREAQEEFNKVTKRDYLRIKNELNSVEILGKQRELVSLEKRKEIWDDLHSQLITHINTLKKLYPYHDFSKAYKKAEDVVFRIRYAEENMGEVADQFTSKLCPFIGIHIEPQYVSDAHGLTGLRHEFTHLCCELDYDSYVKERTNLTRFPVVLEEGVTQYIQTSAIIYENFDEDSIKLSKDTYYVYTKIAEIYKNLFGEKVLIESYFSSDMTLINNSFKELASQIPRFSKLIDDRFLERLNIDLNRLFLTTRRNNDADTSITSINRFPYLMKFFEFAYIIFDREPNFDIAFANLELINDVINSLDNFFDERKIGKKAALR